MKKIIYMLVVILGMASCDNNDNYETYPSSQFESFRIGTGNYSVTINDLLNTEFSESYIEDDTYILIYDKNGTKFTLTLSEDYGCVIILNSSINNQFVDYDKFKSEILKLYFDL